MTKPTFTWTKIEPKEDPKYGKPCMRSSHGIAYIPSSSSSLLPRLIVYGGETIARTPLEASQATWACDFVDDDGKASCWRWIASPPPPLRVAHAQAVHEKTSTVYVFGGRAGITMEEMAMNDLWKLDCSGPPGTETWSQVHPNTDSKNDNNSHPPPEHRSFHRMICLGDNLYVFGGCTAKHGRLADMYRFDLNERTWHNLGTSQHLRGRGGATFLSLDSGKYLGVVAGFAGEETNDGHLFDVENAKWCDDSATATLEGLRPRSVCLGGSFPSVGVAIIFGGEVDPSDKGHEGAGGFENDIVVLEEKSGKYLGSTPAVQVSWPENRGWSDGVAVDNGNGSGKLYLFGGLSGDDTNPRRLDDLWMLQVSKQ